ncbi:MAG TPA: PhzF family phenazine biosynthesis protein [Streptosporangiaceae bacterium]|jgi:PhzF family phenazine biosynthesis protein
MRIRVIDAFTDRPFAGNPAAVCLLDGDGWPDERWMRDVAVEMNLSETAFARPLPAGADADWALRWFTTVTEVNLCGHATLATVHALASDGRLPGGSVRFETRSGVLTARVEDGSPGSITLDFPAAPAVDTAEPDGLAAAIGAKPEAVYTTGALGDLMAVLPDEAAVRGLAPDFAAIAAITDRAGQRGVIVTAPADAGRPYDYVSRFFAPAVLAGANPEDPVTGSAHTALAPYWAARLGRDGLTAHQVSARTGTLHTSLHADRVHLRGQATTVLDGTLLPTPA